VEAQSKESEQRKQELFNWLCIFIEFDCMDPGYILLLVSWHPRILAAGLQGEVLTKSLIRSNMARRTPDEVETLIEQTKETELVSLPSRGRKGSWVFEVSFTAAEAAAVEPDKECRKVVGLAEGLPWTVELFRLESEAEGEVQDAFITTTCSLPFQWMDYGPDKARRLADGDEGAGFFFQYKLEAGLGAPCT
jgi:hypothetical protein